MCWGWKFGFILGICYEKKGSNFNLNKFELSCFKGWQKHVKIFACFLKCRHYVWLLFMGMWWETDPICYLVFTKFNSCCQASYSIPPNSGRERERILYICTHLPSRTELMKNWFTFIDVGQNLKSPPQKKTLYNYMYTHPHKTRFCGFVIIDTYSPHKLWERQLPNKCIIQMMLSGWLAYYQYLDQFLQFAPLICDLCVLYKVFCSKI